MGILPVYSGTAMHDGWSSYFKFDCLHYLFNSHHPRELTFIHEEEIQNWSKEFMRVLATAAMVLACLIVPSTKIQATSLIYARSHPH
ncbi:MAG: hypothetical protein A4E44_00253 [Methanosaeta sp. PtaB.Bin018]|jgi:hypothetical protein|nr:hypothetical protein [Methanothrix sp.]OPX76929.1 MAG: hypothetical protein A4E44_00253 [Methanosaeta sp. PtaB.Bin018]OPY47186.1 MAG: hypothetical protein A4E46_00579 [Methanosaeta sp. PtaU1.Bin016]